MTNSFDAKTPETHIYQVVGYMRSHSFLEIGVVKQDNKRQDIIYLVFEGVEYYDGPLVWKGSGLNTCSADKCLEFIHRLDRYNDIPDDYLLQRFKLFAISIISSHKINHEVKILALNGGISKNPSPFFQDSRSTT